MCAELLYSLSLELGLRVTETLMRIPIGRVQRWARKKVLAQIERSLNIGESKFILLGKIGQSAQTEITVRIFSSYPLKLHTEKVIGTLKIAEFETELNWDVKGKSIYKHMIADIEPNRNAWIFVVNIPIETLKTNVSSNWHLKFVAYFQKEYHKTFEGNIKFRKSDEKKLEEDR